MILYSRWLSLPLDIRHKIAAEFNIAKKGATHVVDNKVQNDGFLIEEIETALNRDALQLYLGMMKEKEMEVLWNTLVARMKGEEITIVTPPRLTIGILPAVEAKQFKKEYKQRMKNVKTTK